MGQPEAGAAPGDTPDRSVIETILNREAAIIVGCLLMLVLLAWWWLWRETTRIGDMTAMGNMTDMPGMAIAPDVWTSTYLGAAFLMWTIMMIAMMLPSASPMILIYARFARRSGGGLMNAAIFMLAYAGLWTVFALTAALAQAGLVSAGLVTQMNLVPGKRMMAGLLLIAAGLYQLSPLKRACLDKCRSPVSFLISYWRPGRIGALRLGLSHGLYCIGCCALLMLLLFVGGVMNLAWIAMLTVVVAAEKLAPQWLPINRLIALGLCAAGLFLLLPR